MLFRIVDGDVDDGGEDVVQSAGRHGALIDKAVEMGGTDVFPVMYLDAMYSRKFNREGLMLAARRTHEKLAGKKTKKKKK